MLPIVCLILILMNKYNENILISYTGVIGTGFLIYSLWIRFNSNEFMTDLSEGGIFISMIILALFHYNNKGERPTKLYNNVSYVWPSNWY